jgi:hypothetical protein
MAKASMLAIASFTILHVIFYHNHLTSSSRVLALRHRSAELFGSELKAELLAASPDRYRNTQDRWVKGNK